VSLAAILSALDAGYQRAQAIPVAADAVAHVCLCCRRRRDVCTQLAEAGRLADSLRRPLSPAAARSW